MPEKTPARLITRLKALGDSLSDRGTLDKRELLGFIPMSYISGLSGKSPRGRFTNGFLWGDYIGATIAEQFEIEALRKKLHLAHDARSNADIGDEFLTNERLREKSQMAFSLDDDLHILYKGERFFSFYCEGGLTAYDWEDTFTFDITDEFSRLILATLEDKRKLLFKDDQRYKVSQQEKDETLVIEWSGANDLLTVNVKPTMSEVDKAVNERINNLEQLIQHGYTNIVLFNLPNLSSTPRFQAKSIAEQKNAAACSEYFNAQLLKKSQEIIQKYNTASKPLFVSVFDVNAIFTEVYNSPEQYGFDKAKLKTPYTSSQEFKDNQKNPEDAAKHISPSEGFMFWDDLHPTADTHNLFAERFKEQYGVEFTFAAPQRYEPKSTNAGDLLPNTTTELKDKQKSHSSAPLPDDAITILKKIRSKAKSMCESSNSIRQQKGELLKQFLFEIRYQQGDLTGIDDYISQFKRNQKNMDIIKIHHNPIFDFFAHKKTTRSEDQISDLQSVIKVHLGQTKTMRSLPLS